MMRMSNNAIFLLLFFLTSCSYSSWNRIGSRQLSRREYARAVNAFSFAIKKKEKLAQSYFLRGYALSKLNKHKEAASDFKKSLEIQKTFLAHWALCNVFCAERNWEAADTNFSKLCDAYPDNPWGYFGYGICNLYQLNRYKKAVDCFSRSLELMNSNINFIAAYSRALFCQGEREECVNLLIKNLYTYPDNLTLKVELFSAFIYSSSPDNRDGIREIAEKLNKLPIDSPIKYQLIARVEAVSGNFQNAITNIQKAIAINQGNDDIFSDIYAESLGDILKRYKRNKLYNAVEEQARRMFYFYAPQMLNILDKRDAINDHLL